MEEKIDKNEPLEEPSVLNIKEGKEKDDISIAASVSPMIGASRSKRFSFRRLNTMSTFNDVDIDNHIDYIKEELNKISREAPQAIKIAPTMRRELSCLA